MVAESGTPLSRIDAEEQYRQAYESLRQHDRFIWQTPAIAVVVDGGLVVSAFKLLDIWWVREVVLGCALVLTIVLTFALIKHRYFSFIEQEALSALEEGHAERLIQRTSRPADKKDYWGSASNPNWLQRPSAQRLFITGMWLISALLLLLLILNWLILKPLPTG